MTNPRSAVKRKVLLASATKTANENGSAVDVRGVENAKFYASFGTVSGTWDLKIQGRHTSSDAWTDIPGLTFTQVTGATTEQLPTAANAPGVVLPRYIRYVLTETSAGSAVVEIGMFYERPRIGKQVDHGSVS